MGAAILAWLSSKGISLVLSFVAHLLLDAWKSYQASEALRDAGQKTVEAAQAEAGKTVSDAIAKAAAKDVSEDNALARLREGTG